MTIFDSVGDKLILLSKLDAISKLGQIDTSVPLKTQGRKAHHRERYCIVKYLLILAQNDILEYPVEIEKSAAPDFVLKYSQKEVGIEITEATKESLQVANTAFEKVTVPSYMEPDRFYTENLTKEEAASSIRRMDQPLVGRHTCGDTHYIDWSSTVCEAIKKKLLKLNNGRYSATNNCELLIYDNTGIIIFDTIERAFSYFNTKYSSFEHCYQKHFDNISVLKSDGLIYQIQSTQDVIRNDVFDESD